jgi:preprotein translocase subunit SecE
MNMMKKQADEVERQGLGRKVEDLRIFFEQSKVELKKVVWPDRQEIISTSSAVLLLVVVLAFFLGMVDLGLSKIIAAILS